MPKFIDWLNPMSSKNPIMSGASKLLNGTPGQVQQMSTLRPEQEGLYEQAVNAGKGQGAGGAFGESADYYRNLLSNNPADMEAYAAPELRRYNQEISPGIAEQYAGLGAGGLSGSGHRNAQNQGAVDLSERLGAIRASLRHSGAQGLQNIGEVGLRNYQQTHETPGSEGLLSSAGPAIAAGLTAIGGPVAGAIGGLATSAASNWFGGKGNQVGAKTSPYGGGSPKASPGGGFQLPNFAQR